MTLEWASITDNGRVRDHNEDAVWPEGSGTADGSLIVAVADGMGGAAGGEVASGVGLRTALGVGGNPMIRVQAANLAILDTAREQPRLTGMGTTMTLARLADGRYEIAHVGDSRAYLLRAGKLTQLTRDHSFVADMVAEGRLTPEEAERHPYRSVLTRVVGIDPDLVVDRVTGELEAGDVLLLCSDGLSGMVPDAEVAAFLQAAPDPKGAADRLTAAANEAGGVDNVSVVVVKVSGDA